jgi:hypothetical protein
MTRNFRAANRPPVSFAGIHMAETKKGIVLRLSTEGADTVKRALRELGDDGKDALAKIERSAKTVPPHLRLVDTTAKGVKAEVTSMAGRAGLAGQALSALGPAGVAGAAGLAAVGLGLGAALRIAREATDQFAEIGAAAQQAGLSTDDFQKLGFVASQNEVAVEALTDGMKELQLRADEFITTGKGSAAEAFQRIGFSASDLATRLKNPTELLGEIIRRSEQLSTSARIRVFDEIFGGTGGEQFVRIATQGAAAYEALIQKAEEYGLVVNREVIRNAAKASAELDLASKVIDINLKQAFVDLAPVLVFAAERFGSIARSVNDMVDSFRAIDRQRNLSVLTSELDDVRAAIVRTQAALAASKRGDLTGNLWSDIATAISGGDSAGIAQTLADLKAKEAAIEARIAELNKSDSTSDKPEKPTLPSDTARTDRINKTIEALKFQEAQLGRTAAEQAAYNALERAGIDANDEMAPAVMGAARALYAKQEAAKASAAALKEDERRMQALRDASRDFIGGILSDARDGASGLDILGNAIDRVADKFLAAAANTGGDLLSSAIGSLFGLGSGGSSIPWSWGGFDTGRNAGGTDWWRGGMTSVNEQVREMIYLPRGTRIVPSPTGGAGNVIHQTIAVIGTGDADLLAKVKAAAAEGARETSRAEIRQYDSDVLPARVQQIAADPRAQ